MKKRILVMVFAAFIACSLYGCGGSDVSVPENNDSGSTSSQAVTTDTVKQEEQQQTTQAETKPQSEGDLGNYHIRIGDASVTKDYEGKQVARVEFEFTNNSEDTVAFDGVTMARAYQDGIELEQNFGVDDETDKEVANTSKNVRPGATLTCALCWEIENTDSAIEVEIDEWLSDSGESLAKTFEFKKGN